MSRRPTLPPPRMPSAARGRPSPDVASRAGPSRDAAPRARPARELGERQIEALTVAMIVAPGVYARNRMFDLFTTAGARRARARAGIVRGIVPQLARATTVTVSGEARGGETSFVLRYVVLAVRLTRVVELSGAELAALRLVAERANVRCLPPAAGDRDLVAKALAKLMDGELSRDVARAARDLVPPSSD
ncbi:MAG: hypothetical protein KF795_14370 [Labilithrix sp.]|nr:hypothetical protein [Labilithrix sp.]